MVAEQSGLTYINVGDWVKQHELHSGYDEEHEALIIDEDKVRTVCGLGKRRSAQGKGLQLWGSC
jgi:broad-specificity NMP kinase